MVLIIIPPFIPVIILWLDYRGQAIEEWLNFERLILPMALFAVFYSILIIWILPKIYVKSLQNTSLSGSQSKFEREKEKLKLEDDTRKTLAQIIGGAFFLLGLIFTYNTFVLNREGQINDRFTKAVDQLGDADIAVRLGGLYALERTAKDFASDHPMIIDVMCAYVRENSKKYARAKTSQITIQKKQNDLVKAEKTEDGKIETDIQTALTIIARLRKEHPYGNKIDLSGASISHANLKGIDLGNADLSNADLSYADLSYADLSDAKLFDADLHGANFNHANLHNAWPIRANLEGATLQHADLTYIKLDAAFLTKTNFSGANMSDASIDLYSLKKAIIDETTRLPYRLESYRSELLDLSQGRIPTVRYAP